MLSRKDSEYTVTTETFDRLVSYWLDSGNGLKWDCLFVLPPWLKAWWHIFGKGWTPHLAAVRHRERLIGIAPLMVQGKKAAIMGSSDVCDYLDFIYAGGREQEVFEILLENLRRHGIAVLDIGPLRSDATLLPVLDHLAAKPECEISVKSEDVSLELELPDTWDGFLGRLTGKQRHEIRRKLRRLHEAGAVAYRVVEDVEGVRKEIDTFLGLFGSNRSDKAAFMNSQMSAFFRSVAEAMAERQILKLCFLDLNGEPAAAVMCFHYKATMYVYNNGYDMRFGSLSVGLLSKVIGIQQSIADGIKKYDLLKGGESYKYRLGCEPVPLYRCQVRMG